MIDGDALTAMLALAVATPLIALLAWQAHCRACEAAETPPAPRTRRNLIVLACAGPLNLALWCVLKLWLKHEPLSDAAVCALAALVFIAASFATGWARRHLQRTPK